MAGALALNDDIRFRGEKGELLALFRGMPDANLPTRPPTWDRPIKKRTMIPYLEGGP